MAAYTRRGHSGPYKGTKTDRPAGSWSAKAPREGTVVQHPKTGKWVARKMFYTDSHHDTEEDAHKHLAKWNEPIKKFSEV